MKNVLLFTLIVVIFLFNSCSSPTTSEKSVPIISGAVASTGPDLIIYQTRGDYNNLVPVILNDNKTELTSYPAPGDLKYKGKPATPGLLANGFLLDNRGITSNVAFLSITYDEYMALKKTPSRTELMEWIIDKDPLLVIYNCGKRQLYKNEIEELNIYLLDNDFSKFTKLK